MLTLFAVSLWGNPTHLDHVTAALRDRYPDEPLRILLAKRNIGNFTYDGIELCAERVMREIEDEIEQLKEEDKRVEKISLFGYSLGGLIARYVVGLLYSKGTFDKIEPVNFTTFATPHLGVRTPVIGWRNNLWNAIGGRALSVSGQQMFLIDNFRKTGRPLLAVMADSSSIFIRGLNTFKSKSLYANIINDRSVPFYTAYITSTDPFADLNAIDIRYVPGYDNVILDEALATPKSTALTLYESMAANGQAMMNRAPFLLTITALMPIAASVFLVNSAIQTYQSAQRVKLHEEGKAGIDIGSYRLPFMTGTIQENTDAAIEGMNLAQQEEYLSEPVKSKLVHEDDGLAYSNEDDDHVANDGSYRTLALTKDQFQMIESLDKVGFHKYGVHIHNATHTHAAIILRVPRDTFKEGRMVSKHWTERFEL